MKRLVAVIMVLALMLALISCGSVEKLYEAKAIHVLVTHMEGCTGEYESAPKCDLYFREIKLGDTYKLPNGDHNPYSVDFVITALERDGITITFTEDMDYINGDNPTEWGYGKTFKLPLDESVKFTTPTLGGGDSFVFTIIDNTIPEHNPD